MFVNSWDLASTQSGGDQLGCFTFGNYYNTVCVPQPSTATTGIHIDSVGRPHATVSSITAPTADREVFGLPLTPFKLFASASSLTQTEADVRILQRNSAARTPSTFAEDYPIVDPVDSSTFVFLPSVVRDRPGNLQGILGISGSGINQHPGLDSWNFIPGTLTSATYGYIASPVNDGDAEDTDNLNYRWGDWYSAVLDPSDSCTVWVAGEYLPVNRTTEPYWYTEMAKLPPMSTCSGGRLRFPA